MLPAFVLCARQHARLRIQVVSIPFYRGFTREDVRAQHGSVVLKLIQLGAGRIKVLTPQWDLPPPPSPASRGSGNIREHTP